MNIRIVVQYEGTKYDGWQKQGNTSNTIQAKIEDVLFKMTGTKIEVCGSGRTDAGVHAMGQVANFFIETDKKDNEIIAYLNQYLPTDIAIVQLDVVQERFHSRLNAKAKTYEYRLWTSSIPTVFDRKLVYSYPCKLDIEKMNKAAEYLLGEHDFKAFCSNSKMKKSTVRTINSIDIIKIGKEIRFTFNGDGFLYNMVRILVGTLIEVGEGKKAPEEMKEILESLDRQRAGITAPPQGLMLMQVEY